MGLFALSIDKSIGEDGTRIYIAAGVRIELYNDYLIWDNGVVNREIARIYYSDIISVTYSNGNFASGAFISISTAGKNYIAKASSEYKDIHEMANAIEDMRHKSKNNVHSFPKNNYSKMGNGKSSTYNPVSAGISENKCFLFENAIDEKNLISILENIDNGRHLDAIMMIRNLANVSISDARFIVENFEKIDFHIPYTKEALVAKVNADITRNELECNSSNNTPEAPYVNAIDTEELLTRYEKTMDTSRIPKQDARQQCIEEEKLLSQHIANTKEPIINQKISHKQRISNHRNNGKLIIIPVVCCFLTMLVMNRPANNKSDNLLPYKEASMNYVQDEVKQILDEYNVDEKTLSNILNTIAVIYEEETIKNGKYTIVARYEITIDSTPIIKRVRIEGIVGDTKVGITPIDGP